MLCKVRCPDSRAYDVIIFGGHDSAITDVSFVERSKVQGKEIDLKMLTEITSGWWVGGSFFFFYCTKRLVGS